MPVSCGKGTLAAVLFQVLGTLVLLGACATATPCGAAQYPDPARFENAIRQFEKQDAISPPPAGAIVCAGSSSMRKWHEKIHQDLAPLQVIARGFGGSNMNDLLTFADRIVIAYRPRAVVIYEGDNDLAQGVDPAAVRDKFVALVAKIHAALPETRIYCLAVKPSIARWQLWPKMQQTNRLLAAECQRDKRLAFVDIARPMLNGDGHVKTDLFISDGLHMNRKGYVIWRDTLRPILMQREAAAREPAARQ
jgi:lysophospholipase L1-like esterase